MVQQAPHLHLMIIRNRRRFSTNRRR